MTNLFWISQYFSFFFYSNATESLSVMFFMHSILFSCLTKLYFYITEPSVALHSFSCSVELLSYSVIMTSCSTFDRCGILISVFWLRTVILCNFFPWKKKKLPSGTPLIFKPKKGCSWPWICIVKQLIKFKIINILGVPKENFSSH